MSKVRKYRKVKKCYEKFFEKSKIPILEFEKILVDTGLEISNCKKFIQFSKDTPLEDVNNFIREIKKKVIRYKPKPNKKTNLIRKLWSEEIKSASNVFENINETQISEVFIDDVKKSVFFGFEKNRGVKYAIIGGYFTEKPVFIDASRCSFSFEKTKPIGYGLSIVYWDNNTTTVELEESFPKEEENVGSSQKKFLTMISRLFPNPEFWEFSLKQLEDFQDLRTLLKPSKTELLSGEIELIDKFKDYEMETFMKTMVCSLILGRDPFELFEHFETKIDLEEKNSKKMVNPFLKYKDLYENVTIESVKRSIIQSLKRLKVVVKTSEKKREVKSLFDFVNKIILHEIHYSSLLETVASKVEDLYFYQIDDLSLGLSDYPIKIINTRNLFPFPKIEYVNTMNLFEISNSGIFEFKPLAKCTCDECGDNCPCRMVGHDCHHLCKNKKCGNKLKSKVKIELYQTEKKGWGVQAQTIIPKGTFLGEYTGNLLTDTEGDIIGMEQDKRGCSYIWDLEHINLCLDAELKCNWTKFMNHSCDPNVEGHDVYTGNYQRIGFYALRNIEVGEEITINYKYGDRLDYKIKCECGSKKCKGFI